MIVLLQWVNIKFFTKKFLMNFLRILVCLIVAFFVWRIMSYDFPIRNFLKTGEILSSASAYNISVSNMIQWHYMYVLFICPLIVLSWKKLPCYKFPPALISLSDKVMDWLDSVSPKCDFFIFVFAFTIALYIPICFIISSIFVHPIHLFLYLLVFAFIFAGILFTRSFYSIDYRNIAYICSPIFTTSALFIFFAEILYWLHDHRIAVNSLYAVIIYYSPAVIKAAYNMNRKNTTKTDWDYIYLCASMAVIGISLIRSSVPFDVNFFEWSNHGSAIYGFLYNNEMPLIHNFDPHMLSNFVWGIIYAFINGDYAGAIFSPYSYFNAILAYLGLFLLSKKFIPSKYVFLMIIFFPLNRINGTYFVGIWLLLYFLNWTKHNHSVLNDFIYALLFVFSSIFLLDIGASWGIAFLICGLGYIILDDSSHKARFILSIFTVTILFSILFIFLLYVNEVDFLSWVEKFLNVCFSNQNWAYGVIGSPLVVIVVYCICPVIMIGIAMQSLITLKHAKASAEAWTMLFLCLTWLLNMQRALVRHSMVEFSAITFGLILIVFILYMFTEHRKYKSIILVLFAASLFASSTVKFGIVRKSASTFLSNPAFIEKSTHSIENTIVNITERSTKRINDVKNFLDSTLTSSDTFLDFTNQTLLYSLTGREKVMYVNQSPGLVNGIRGQKEFISETSEKMPKLALMPYVPNNVSWWGVPCFYELDGIKNLDRYFLISDYIISKYRPLCIVDNFAVWCLKEYYNDLAKLCSNRQLLVGYDYNSQKFYHHKLGFIPFIWGQSNNNQNFERHEILFNGDFWEIPEKLAGTINSALIIEINSAHDIENAYFEIINPELSFKTKYSFNVKKGIHKYKIHCSSDLLWHEINSKHLLFSNMRDAQVSSCYILNGE